MQMKVNSLAVITFCILGCAQVPRVAPSVFTDSELDFRYSPPPNARNDTEATRQSIQQRATEIHTTNIRTVLLSLYSGLDDTAPNWYRIGIQTYPRERLGSVSERNACQTFSRWVSGIGQETGQPADIEIGGTRFVLSTFELHEGQLTKQARVYTTVRNGRMLSFSFSANSSDVLNRITESMKTFQPDKPKQSR
jgi:hypothetical protein